MASSAPVDPFSSLISILVYGLVLPAAGIAQSNAIGIHDDGIVRQIIPLGGNK